MPSKATFGAALERRLQLGVGAHPVADVGEDGAPGLEPAGRLQSLLDRQVAAAALAAGGAVQHQHVGAAGELGARRLGQIGRVDQAARRRRC